VPSAKAQSGVDVSWYPPSQTAINNLTEVIIGAGVYSFIFNSSDSPDGEYGVYNWCNMPHVRRTEYITPASNYELVYIEVVSAAFSQISSLSRTPTILGRETDSDKDPPPPQAHPLRVQFLPRGAVLMELRRRCALLLRATV
jgi:hypothetical protein